MTLLSLQNKSLIALMLGLAIFASFSMAPVALGRGGDDHPTVEQTASNKVDASDETSSSDSSVSAHGVRAEGENTDAHRANLSHPLSDVNLRICRRREASINNIMSRIAERGERQLDVFSKIASRTENFYESKGLSVANYDALVADVNAKRTAAESAVATIKSTSVSFKCDGSDPKGAADGFKSSLKAEISALKEFKTAVRNLIVAIKSASESQGSSD